MVLNAVGSVAVTDTVALASPVATVPVTVRVGDAFCDRLTVTLSVPDPHVDADGDKDAHTDDDAESGPVLVPHADTERDVLTLNDGVTVGVPEIVPDPHLDADDDEDAHTVGSED